MKEVTYEDWQKNPTVRMMWVWNSKVEDKVKRMVLFLTERNPSHPVIALTSDSITVANYKHCAEIEKQRRMTNKELARWIRENPTREWEYKNGVTVYGYYGYEEKCENEEVPNNILIREDDSGWHEPLVEVEE